VLHRERAREFCLDGLMTGSLVPCSSQASAGCRPCAVGFPPREIREVVCCGHGQGGGGRGTQTCKRLIRATNVLDRYGVEFALENKPSQRQSWGGGRGGGMPDGWLPPGADQALSHRRREEDGWRHGARWELGGRWVPLCGDYEAATEPGRTAQPGASKPPSPQSPKEAS